MKEILKKHNIENYGVAPFSSLHLFDTKNRAKLPQDARSAICCIFPYYNDEAADGNISVYCSVKDYHRVIGDILDSVCADLCQKYPNECFVRFVDASPIDEVDLAVRAGLGVRGDNSLLINEKYGSYVFIGEIITSMALPATDCENRGCLHCGACMRACAGSAIKCGVVDTSLCASAISQKKGELTDAETKILKKAHTVFGCDICQRVCPMNKNIVKEKNLFSDDILSVITHENVQKVYKERPFGWRGVNVLLRNLSIYDSTSEQK